METILLKQVIEQMDMGLLFDIQFVTCDRNRGTGGQIKEMKKVLKRGDASKTEKAIQQAQRDNGTILKKHPRHYENSTRNIYDPRTKETRKVHLRLITMFNGKRVL